MRHASCLKDLEPRQGAAALTLPRESMSASGFETTSNVVRLTDCVRELTGRTEE